MAKRNKVGHTRKSSSVVAAVLGLLLSVVEMTALWRVVVWIAIAALCMRQVWDFRQAWLRPPAKVAVSVGLIAGVAILAWITWPKIIVSEKFPGQWPGYTNADYVLLDDSANFTMAAGTIQSIYPNVDGTKNLSNVYLEFCVPRTFRVIELTKEERQGYATFAHDDIDKRKHPDWNDCEQYTVPMGRITAGDPSNPNPIRFEARQVGTHRFNYYVSASEVRLNTSFPIVVTPCACRTRTISPLHSA